MFSEARSKSPLEIHVAPRSDKMHCSAIFSRSCSAVSGVCSIAIAHLLRPGLLHLLYFNSIDRLDQLFLEPIYWSFEALYILYDQGSVPSSVNENRASE